MALWGPPCGASSSGALPGELLPEVDSTNTASKGSWAPGEMKAVFHRGFLRDSSPQFLQNVLKQDAGVPTRRRC
jgi:hypothetical protein